MSTAKLKSKTAVEEVLYLVGLYDRRGYSTREIRTELKAKHNIDVSHVTVHVRLKQVRESYKEMGAAERTAAVAEKLLQYGEVRREAWAAWERSKQDAGKTVEERTVVRDEEDDPSPRKAGRKKGRFADPTDPGLMQESLRLLKRIETREGRLPANAYLQTIMDTLAAERELLGLDAPTKIDARAAVLHGEAGQVVGFEALVEGDGIDGADDSVEAEIAGVAQRALPAAGTNGTPQDGDGK